MLTLHVVADSISMHYGPYLGRYISSWCQYSRKEGRIGALDNPEGPNGGDSSMVLTYLKKCIDQEMHWDIVIANSGLWDIRSFDGVNQVNITQYRNNLLEMYKLLSQVTNHIMWIRTTPVSDELHNTIKHDFKRFNSDVERYNSVADEIAVSHGIWIIDLYNFCRSIGGAEMYCDHIHFTDEMRKIQGAFVAGQIVASINLIIS